MEEIVVIIKGGKLEIEAVGYNGVGCDAATKFLEQLGQLESVEHKPEFNTKEAAHRVRE